MARTNNLIMSYVIRQNQSVGTRASGKWYAFVNRPGTLSTRGLSQHLIEHGLVSNRGEVEAVLSKLAECIPELVAQGYGVKLDGLGIFYPTLANKGGGAESPEEFNISENVVGVRFRFRPDTTNLDDLTSKVFGKKVTFGNGYKQLEKNGPLYRIKAETDGEEQQEEEQEP